MGGNVPANNSLLMEVAELYRGIWKALAQVVDKASFSVECEAVEAISRLHQHVQTRR